MSLEVIVGILIPFLGTSLGASCVYLMKGEMSLKIRKLLLGFAAGVMTAASVWSLLIPSIEESSYLGKLSFLPACIGFLIGVTFLFLLDSFIPHMHYGTGVLEGAESSLKRTTKLMLAVTIHNIPEGMAVGVIFAGLIAGDANITFGGAMALSFGIAIQNFPEGAVISMPLLTDGLKKNKAFLYGVLSGVVEPVAAALTVACFSLVLPILPYVLSFAAGAMIYVVVEELIPEASTGKHSDIGVIFFSIGFTVMMILDVMLG